MPRLREQFSPEKELSVGALSTIEDTDLYELGSDLANGRLTQHEYDYEVHILMSWLTERYINTIDDI